MRSTYAAVVYYLLARGHDIAVLFVLRMRHYGKGGPQDVRLRIYTTENPRSCFTYPGTLLYCYHHANLLFMNA